MAKEVKGASAVIDRVKLSARLDELTKMLEQVTENVNKLNAELYKQIEQSIGLKHRIAELTELLK